MKHIGSLTADWLLCEGRLGANDSTIDLTCGGKLEDVTCGKCLVEHGNIRVTVTQSQRERVEVIRQRWLNFKYGVQQADRDIRFLLTVINGEDPDDTTTKP